MGGMNITVGDFVVYPGRRGSDMWLRYGFVENVVVSKNKTVVKVLRGIKYLTYDIDNEQHKETDYYKRTYSVWNTNLITKVDFNETKFSNPAHPENKIFKQIQSHLTNTRIDDFPILSGSDNGC